MLAIESSYESVHSLFMVSGFLQAFSFMVKWYQRTSPGQEQPTAPHIFDGLSFFAFRILKLMPVYVFCLIYMVYVQINVSTGPMWQLMASYVEPCFQERSSWFWNLAFVNNLMLASPRDEFLKAEMVKNKTIDQLAQTHKLNEIKECLPNTTWFFACYVQLSAMLALSFVGLLSRYKLIRYFVITLHAAFAGYSIAFQSYQVYQDYQTME